MWNTRAPSRYTGTPRSCAAFRMARASSTGITVPPPAGGEDYRGYPLVADADPSLAWFLGGLPLLIAAIWWRVQRPPACEFSSKHGDQP